MSIHKLHFLYVSFHHIFQIRPQDKSIFNMLIRGGAKLLNGERILIPQLGIELRIFRLSNRRLSPLGHRGLHFIRVQTTTIILTAFTLQTNILWKMFIAIIQTYLMLLAIRNMSYSCSINITSRQPVNKKNSYWN